MTTSTWESEALRRLQDKEATVTVVGCGYVGLTLAVGAATLGAARPGLAANQSVVCRLAIAKASSKVTLTGYKDALTCRKAADKAGQATGPCDVPGSSGFDPKGAFASAKSKGMTAISARCLSGDPVLGNYDGGDPAGAVFPDELGSGECGVEALRTRRDRPGRRRSVGGRLALDGDKHVHALRSAGLDRAPTRPVSVKAWRTSCAARAASGNASADGGSRSITRWVGRSQLSARINVGWYSTARWLASHSNVRRSLQSA